MVVLKGDGSCSLSSKATRGRAGEMQEGATVKTCHSDRQWWWRMGGEEEGYIDLRTEGMVTRGEIIIW